MVPMVVQRLAAGTLEVLGQVEVQQRALVQQAVVVDPLVLSVLSDTFQVSGCARVAFHACVLGMTKKHLKLLLVVPW